MNLYGFTGGDPVNFSDPLGLCPISKDGIPCRVYGVNGADMSKVRPEVMDVFTAIAEASGHNLGVGFATEGTHTDPCHKGGCAIDIDKIDDVDVGSYGSTSKAAAGMVTDVQNAARANPLVRQVISPNGNWMSNSAFRQKKALLMAAGSTIWKEHQSHLHVSAYTAEQGNRVKIPDPKWQAGPEP